LDDLIIGSSRQRDKRIAREIDILNAETILLCPITGSSHCAIEGCIIVNRLTKHTQHSVLDFKFPTLTNPYQSSVATRLEALTETARNRGPL